MTVSEMEKEVNQYLNEKIVEQMESSPLIEQRKEQRSMYIGEGRNNSGYQGSAAKTAKSAHTGAVRVDIFWRTTHRGSILSNKIYSTCVTPTLIYLKSVKRNLTVLIELF